MDSLQIRIDTLMYGWIINSCTKIELGVYRKRIVFCLENPILSLGNENAYRNFIFV